ncbi:MAG: cation-transporting P-type ATPase [Candidatus Moranbacteria bacterium]|nr:cation-transporting P-type ATPase [Candidatus Moranbacteria bacterium]
MQKQIYSLTKEEVLKKTDSTIRGLTTQEAEERLKQAGFNEVQKKQNWSWFSLLINQFNDALVWILLVAGGLAFLFHEYRDTTIILLIVGINALIGFFQEYRAEKTLENIRRLASDKAIVLRDGKRKEINAKFLVPGDIIHIAAGDTIAADAYLLESYDVYVNEFIFTGESRPGRKIVQPIAQEGLSLVDIDNMVFMGTAMTRGTAIAVVTQTGMQTQLGNIANLVAEVKEEETPLQKQMGVLGRDVTIAALTIGFLVLIAGFYSKTSLYDNFLFALALSVSVVPEGLPAAISVALSLGMKKLLKKNVLAKKLNSVETLASVNVICTDKTGTITRNELMVTNILCGQEELTVDGEGYSTVGNFYLFGRKINHLENRHLRKLLQIGVICNDADVIEKDKMCLIAGDPTEGALLVVAKKFENDLNFFQKTQEKIDEFPFSSERMRMSVICKDSENSSITSFVKGSPDVLIDLCRYKQVGDQVMEFTKEDRERARNNFNSMSEQALRVLAFATRDMSEISREQYEKEAEKDLIWFGTMGMIDPPRLDVRSAIMQCVESSIKPIMITGDYEITAKAIAKNVGMLRSSDSEVINGRRLNDLSDNELIAKIKEKDVIFARIAPEQKLRIATALKNSGFVIAMTGDGVNDAPALKRADIGIAMGKIGTDVAKNASDMILLDDNFASIVEAVKEGRTIYQNLRKFVYYVFTSNVSEFFTVAIGVLLGLPAPIAAVQILAIDLGTDIFPSFSLSLEPSEPGVMGRKPFRAKERVIDKDGIFRLIRVGLLMAVGAIVAFVLSMRRGGWDFGNKFDPESVLYLKSTTVAYAVLSMTQMANLLQARSENLSVFAIGFFKNVYALGAILISVGILLCFIYIPFLSKYLHMSPIDWKDWIAVMATTFAVFVFEEARKSEGNKKTANNMKGILKN